MFASKKQKTMSCIVFGIYAVLLVWLVLFKFAVGLSEFPSMRSINWIPFHYDTETNTHLSEVLYNIAVFVPLGVGVQMFFGHWSVAKKCLPIFATSLLLEAVQFAFAIGASDITDLIGNTLGGLIGIGLCFVMKKVMPKKHISVINTVGFVIEIAAVGLLVLLLAANSK